MCDGFIGNGPCACYLLNSNNQDKGIKKAKKQVSNTIKRKNEITNSKQHKAKE